MKEQSITRSAESRPAGRRWRPSPGKGMQRLLQRLLEEEVEDVLGRRRYERREGVDARAGLSQRLGQAAPAEPDERDDHGAAAAGAGAGRRASRASCCRCSSGARRKWAGCCPSCTCTGWRRATSIWPCGGCSATGAPLSAASIARLKAGWQAEYELWKRRRLADLEPVYVWVDGIYVKAGLEKDKAAMLVVIAALRDGRKVVLAVESGYRESTESWAALLRDLKRRGLRAPRLVIADGHLGIWGALADGLPDGRRAALLEPPDRERARQAAEEAAGRGASAAHADPLRRDAGGGRAAEARVPGVGHEEGRRRRGPGAWTEDWERLVTFYAFPKAHWKHLRTTNVVESPFAAVRLRTAAAKRFKKVENATAVIWKTLLRRRADASGGSTRPSSPFLI